MFQSLYHITYYLNYILLVVFYANDVSDIGFTSVLLLDLSLYKYLHIHISIRDAYACTYVSLVCLWHQIYHTVMME